MSAILSKVTGNPHVQTALTEISSTSTTGLILFGAIPLILGLCVMSYVAKRDTVQNSNVFQLIIAFSLLVGYCLFGIAANLYKSNPSGLMYFLLAVSMICLVLIVGNGGIAVLLTDSYNTSSQWIQKAAQ